jgi:hypothetical protein
LKVPGTGCLLFCSIFNLPESALFLMNSIRKAMETTQTEQLKGDVEVDELFIGGKARKIERLGEYLIARSSPGDRGFQ